MTSAPNVTLALRASDSTERSPYGYIPTVWVCYIFLALFGVSGILHFIQAIRYKSYWMIPTAVLCVVGELIGWSGRLWSYYDISNANPYMMQISTTIIAPTPLLAVNFIVFTRVVQILGQQYCLLSSRWISILFISADIIALVVQGLGGGIASGTNVEKAKLGGNIMLGGIAFQFSIMVIASLLAIHFTWRWSSRQPAQKGEEMDSLNSSTPPEKMHLNSWFPLNEVEKSKLKFLICGIMTNAFFLFVRAIYRLIELSDGWTGEIITTEKWFNIFDGAMVVLAVYTINLAHPGRLLPDIQAVTARYTA